MANNKIFLIFCGLTLINLGILFFRSDFSYKPYASYSSLYGSCGSACMHTWKKFVQDYSPEELDEARKIMDTVIKNKNEETYTKIEEIGKFLYNKFYKQTGTPFGAILKATPLQQYTLLCSDDSVRLWCGNYAEMFAFFCWSQNIVCRVVEIRRFPSKVRPTKRS